MQLFSVHMLGYLTNCGRICDTTGGCPMTFYQFSLFFPTMIINVIIIFYLNSALLLEPSWQPSPSFGARCCRSYLASWTPYRCSDQRLVLSTDSIRSHFWAPHTVTHGPWVRVVVVFPRLRLLFGRRERTDGCARALAKGRLEGGNGAWIRRPQVEMVKSPDEQRARMLSLTDDEISHKDIFVSSQVLRAVICYS